MKKILVTILFVLGLQNSIFAATQLPIIGHWEYVAKETAGHMLSQPEGYKFKNDLDGTYLTGNQAVGQDYFINEPGTNIYHKYVIHLDTAYFTGKMKYPDGHYEWYDKGVWIDGVTFAPGDYVWSWGGYDIPQHTEALENLTNAHIGSFTLETLPADAIYITLPEGIPNDGPLKLCKYNNGSSGPVGNTYSSPTEQFGPGQGAGVSSSVIGSSQVIGPGM